MNSIYSIRTFPVAALCFSCAVAAVSAQENTRGPAPKSVVAANPVENSIQHIDLDLAVKVLESERPASSEPTAREADQPMRSSGSGGGDELRRRMLELFDRDKNGRLDDEERAEAQRFAKDRGLGNGPEMRKEMVRRFDKNGNGTIDEDERPAVEQFFRERNSMQRPTETPTKPDVSDNAALEKVLRSAVESTAAQLRRFDEDKNGKLSDGEWSVARREIQKLTNKPVSATGMSEDGKKPDMSEQPESRRPKRAAKKQP